MSVLNVSIEIEDFYPYSYQPKIRYGGDHPPHSIIEPILANNLKQYEKTLRQFAGLSSDLLKISRDFDPSQPHAPYWINGFFPGLDSITLYGMVATQKPNIFCEIGSGNSTKFAVAAKSAHSPNTKVISIDPEPRAEVDQICDTMIRKPLQECDLSIFQSLQRGDILFLDGSHRTLQNSDATIFFLEILPHLNPGVIVQVHDIFWPFDYPLAWSKRMYSEQYLLGALLIYSGQQIDVLLPNAYISHDQKLTSTFQEIWDAPALEGIETHGASFWFTKKELQAQVEQASTQKDQTITQLEQANLEKASLEAKLQQHSEAIQHQMNVFEQTVQALQAELQQHSEAIQHQMNVFEQTVQALQAELQRSQERNKHLEAELQDKRERLQLKKQNLENKKSELSDARAQIAAMESSKFWKLREKWFRFKRIIRLQPD